MSCVGQEEQQVILALLREQISEPEFFAMLSMTPREGATFALAVLWRGFLERDPICVELGLYLGFRLRMTKDHLVVLLALAEEDWHQRHEEVVDALAQLGSPASVDTLYRVATKRCVARGWEETQCLAAKCVRALGAIQSREALRRLFDILHGYDRALSVEAEAELRRLCDSRNRVRSAG